MMRKPITWILAPVLIFGLVPQMSCSMFAGGGQRFVEGNLYKDNKVDFKARRMGILDFQSYTPERTDGRYAADMITIELLFSGFNVLERRYEGVKNWGDGEESRGGGLVKGRCRGMLGGSSRSFLGFSRRSSGLGAIYL